MTEIFFPYIEGFLHSQHAYVWLFVLSFTESSFFPIPPDALMIPLALVKPHFALVLATITTIGSALGGILGYIIGNKGGKPIVSKIISDEKLYAVKLIYQKYDVWAIIVAGFTPLPYKVFTIAAGLFDLDIKRFFIASIIGRGARFFIVAGLIFIYGEKINHFLSEYFELITIGFAVLIVLGFIILRQKSKKLPSPSKDNQTPTPKN